jgi:hypothetical protein
VPGAPVAAASYECETLEEDNFVVADEYNNLVKIKLQPAQSVQNKK